MLNLFLGAGASKPFGYPTTWDFIEISDRHLAQRFPLYSEVRSFFDLKNRPPDIESILWEMHSLTQCIECMREESTFKKWYFFESNRANYTSGGSGKSFEPFMTQICNSIPGIISEINKLVYETYWAKSDGINEAQKCFETLFNAFANENVNIFSTNYDLIIESILGHDMHNFSDGFRTNHEDRSYIWDIRHYGGERIKLYKLHGSLNWKLHPDGRIYSIPVSNFTSHDHNVMLYPGFKGEPVAGSGFGLWHLKSNTGLAKGKNLAGAFVNAKIPAKPITACSLQARGRIGAGKIIGAYGRVRHDKLSFWRSARLKIYR